MLGDWPRYFVQGPQDGLKEGELPPGAVGPLPPFDAAAWDLTPVCSEREPSSSDDSGDEGGPPGGGAGASTTSVVPPQAAKVIDERMRSSALQPNVMGSPRVDGVGAVLSSLDLGAPDEQMEGLVDPDASTDDQSVEVVGSLPPPAPPTQADLQLAVTKVAVPKGMVPKEMIGQPVTIRATHPGGARPKTPKRKSGVAQYAGPRPGHLRAATQSKHLEPKATPSTESVDAKGQKIMIVSSGSVDDNAGMDQTIHPRGSQQQQAAAQQMEKDLVQPAVTVDKLDQIFQGIQALSKVVESTRDDNAKLTRRLTLIEEGKPSTPGGSEPLDGGSNPEERERERERARYVPSPLVRPPDYQRSPLESSDYNAGPDPDTNFKSPERPKKTTRASRRARARSRTGDTFADVLEREFVWDDDATPTANIARKKVFDEDLAVARSRQTQSMRDRNAARSSVEPDPPLGAAAADIARDPTTASPRSGNGTKRDRTGDEGGSAPKKRDQRGRSVPRTSSSGGSKPSGKGKGRGKSSFPADLGATRPGHTYSAAASSVDQDPDDIEIVKAQAKLDELRKKQGEKRVRGAIRAPPVYAEAPPPQRRLPPGVQQLKSPAKPRKYTWGGIDCSREEYNRRIAKDLADYRADLAGHRGRMEAAATRTAVAAESAAASAASKESWEVVPGRARPASSVMNSKTGKVKGVNEPLHGPHRTGRPSVDGSSPYRRPPPPEERPRRSNPNAAASASRPGETARPANTGRDVTTSFNAHWYPNARLSINLRGQWVPFYVEGQGTLRCWTYGKYTRHLIDNPEITGIQTYDKPMALGPVPRGVLSAPTHDLRRAAPPPSEPASSSDETEPVRDTPR